MARRRYQKGTVAVRNNNWVARWREDVVRPDGSIHRIHRRAVLGTKQDFKTKREAQRTLDLTLAPINSLDYRPTYRVTFREFGMRSRLSLRLSWPLSLSG